jgi:hypothetical protein
MGWASSPTCVTRCYNLQQSITRALVESPCCLISVLDLHLHDVIVLVVCAAGYGGSNCIECAPGSWANGTSTADCVTCPANTTTAAAGATSAAECSGEEPADSPHSQAY